MKKECQVIMLPSSRREDSCIFNTTDNKTFRVGNAHGEWKNGNSIKFFDLYIVSDDEIKEGDWYINNNVIFKADDKFDDGNNPNQNKKNKKIIATTDILSTNIMIDCLSAKPKELILPQVQQSFLKEFVKNPDGEYDCEYDWMYSYPDGTLSKNSRLKENAKPVFKLKLNQDNTVNINSIKEKVYSKKEMEKAYHYGRLNPTLDLPAFDKWIKNNF